MQSFSSGDYHNLAALEDGSVVSWGSVGPWRYDLVNALLMEGNSLGLGDVTGTHTPTVIEGLNDVA